MKLQNETTTRQAVHGKWYGDACGTAFALELVGERWSLLIIRELLLGGRRFTDIRAGLPGISAKVLAERLEGLERGGILRRLHLPPPAVAQIYELTPWGYGAEPAIQALGRWAAASPDHDPTLPLSAVSLIVSLRTMFDATRAGRQAISARIRIGQEDFHAVVRDGALQAGRGEVEGATFELSAAQAPPLAAAIYGKVPFADLAPAGLAVAGDESAARAFVDIFHLPPKVARGRGD